MKLLLVEDETALRNIIAKGLRRCNYSVDLAADGEEALEFYEVYDYDLIVLDLNLPKIDGIEVLRRVRSNNNEIKILILSARTEIEDIIKGLDDGANDYLVKPFDFNELEARIRSLLRRSFIQNDVVLTLGDMKVNTAQKFAAIYDIKFDLTKKEYSILEYLMFNKNKVISPEQLIEHVWDSEVDSFSNSLKYHIYSLKKKIRAVSPNDEFIKNIRGQGYIISESKVDGNVK
ncbi:response regulator transcription factor [Paenibacillus glucanolyticus]|uniref:response regulator transcription factor n=1 Tax=Paenibacillus glucanolyticus TaxID=59843 RepID=UPI0030C9D8D1